MSTAAGARPQDARATGGGSRAGAAARAGLWDGLGLGGGGGRGDCRGAGTALAGVLSPEKCSEEGEAAGRAGRKFGRICRELLLPQG